MQMCLWPDFFLNATHCNLHNCPFLMPNLHRSVNTLVGFSTPVCWLQTQLYINAKQLQAPCNVCMLWQYGSTRGEAFLFDIPARPKHGDICWMLSDHFVENWSFFTRACAFVLESFVLLLQTTVQECLLLHHNMCDMFRSPSNLMFCLTVFAAEERKSGFTPIFLFHKKFKHMDTYK